MADHIGSYNASGTRTTVRFAFTTHQGAGGTVAPSSAFEAADILIYKDGSATQRTSANGITMTSPFDSIVGLHHVSIDLTDNTDAGFYAAGSWYMIVLSPDETVDSQTVVKVLAYFEIGPPPVNVTQWLGTAASTPTVAGVPNVNVKTWNDLTTVALPLVPTTAGRTLDVSSGGEAGVDWANVGSPTTTVGLTGTTISTTQQVDVQKSMSYGVMAYGTVDAGASTTSVPTSACTPAGAVADQFKNRVMIFSNATTTAALRSVASAISASTNAAAPTFTVATLPATPASGDTFVIV